MNDSLASARNTSSLPPEKPRLTEQEKKTNHIASEQKRRQAIREGFDKLAGMVPGMSGQGRSEAVVLGATLNYLKAQIRLREELLGTAGERAVNTADYEIPSDLFDKAKQVSC